MRTHTHTHTPCTDDSVGGTLAILAQFPELSNRLRRGTALSAMGKGFKHVDDTERRLVLNMRIEGISFW